jgi:hypothetical protein
MGGPGIADLGVNDWIARLYTCLCGKQSNIFFEICMFHIFVWYLFRRRLLSNQ